METPDRTLIFEFKVDQPAATAMQQIRDQGYAERFGQTNKDILLIGVSFDAQARGVGEWKVEGA